MKMMALLIRCRVLDRVNRIRLLRETMRQVMQPGSGMNLIMEQSTVSRPEANEFQEFHSY